MLYSKKKKSSEQHWWTANNVVCGVRTSSQVREGILKLGVSGNTKLGVSGNKLSVSVNTKVRCGVGIKLGVRGTTEHLEHGLQ